VFALIVTTALLAEPPARTRQPAAVEDGISIYFSPGGGSSSSSA
jgi:hypothetical protein